MSRVFRSAGASIAIGNSSACAQFTAPPRAPDEVSTSWNAGQILSIRLTTPSPAVTGSALATFLISATASLKRRQARCEPFHPNARERSRDLNVHVCFPDIPEYILAYRGVHDVGQWRSKPPCAKALARRAEISVNRPSTMETPESCGSSKDSKESSLELPSKRPWHAGRKSSRISSASSKIPWVGQRNATPRAITWPICMPCFCWRSSARLTLTLSWSALHRFRATSWISYAATSSRWTSAEFWHRGAAVNRKGSNP